MNGLRDDRGSILLLGIGLIAICLAAALAVFDGAAMFQQRAQLTALADSAALAGAQEVDLDAYYLQGAQVGTRLNPALVDAAVRRHIVRASADIAGLRIESISTDGSTVQVRLSAPLDLPVLGDALAARTEVASAARLDFRP